MLLTENIVLRYHEWQDRKNKPDLVPRMRRLWKRELTDGVPRERRPYRPFVSRHHPALQSPRGV
jgi:hypothetical protein